MRSCSIVALFAAMAALFCASAVSAQTIEMTDNVFHVRACQAPELAGRARCHAHIVTDRFGRFLARPMATTSLPPGYGPSDLRSAYEVTGTGSSSTIIAVVDAYGYPNAEADLDVYRAKYGLPACTSANGCFAKYNESGVKGSYPAMDLGWAQETALDLAMVSAICPNCKIILVEANSSSFYDLAQAEDTAVALHAHVISNSYGGPELGTMAIESAYNHAGIAITASTGDSGYGVQFPASSPHVTAVGGTNLYRASNARGWTETAWSKGGSGCSSYYGKPVWQHDPLCTMRMAADVSAVASPSTGVAVYGPTSATNNAWLVFGGTSVAAPIVAGLYGVNGGAVTYGSNPYATNIAHNDITSGKNGTCGGTYFCTAVTGYDGPTGLGTPVGTNGF